MAISLAYGASRDYFGHEDYVAARSQGKSDQEILSFLNSNPSVLREANVKGGGGLYDQIAGSVRNSSSGSSGGGGGSFSSYQPSNDYQQQLAGYQKQLEESKSSYEKQLGDLRSSLDQYRSQFDAARMSYESTLKQRDDALKQKETDLLKAQSDVQSYQADAERYRDLSINSQLQDLRSGAQVQGGPQGGETPSLTSGVRRTSRSDDGTLVDVRGRIDATDSVLGRKRPVVDVISSPAATNRSAGAAGADRSTSRSGAAGYYARRFG